MSEKLPFDEKITIRHQMNLYIAGKPLDKRSIYDYKCSELNPLYTTQVLDPFIKHMKRDNTKPLVLDLGTGKGEEGTYMDSREIRTIKADISKAGLKDIKNSIQTVAWRLPFHNAFFDGIHSKDMITHIPPEYRPKLFSELNRITKPGGIVLLCFVNESENGNNQFQTSIKGLELSAQQIGFTIHDKQVWRPSNEYKDWYENKNPRFILKLKNKPMTHYINVFTK